MSTDEQLTAPRAHPPAGPDWLAGGFRGTFDYRGRATRGEFWNWWFFWQGSTLAALFIGSAISTAPDAAAGLAAIVWILLAIPSVAVAVRRLHDLDQSAWFLLMALVPIFNLALLLMLAQRGSVGANRFGVDLYARDAATYPTAPLLKDVDQSRPGEGVNPATPGDDEVVAAEARNAKVTPPETEPRPERSERRVRRPALVGGVVAAIALLAGGAGGYWTGHVGVVEPAGATTYRGAFDIVQTLRAAGIECEPAQSLRDPGFSLVECSTAGGAYTVVHVPGDAASFFCDVSFGEPVLWGRDWIVVPGGEDDWSGDPVFFPALAPPEAMHEALGGELVPSETIPNNCPA